MSAAGDTRPYKLHCDPEALGRSVAMDDPDIPGADYDLDYDLLTFEERDEIDSTQAVELRALLTGLPARPGTRR